ncbi:HNH endonuclease [Paraburkholderia phenoliruptrix]|uniref:HNH endonuclease n=1 Tax=Paraburkholderia phenoliruptrix TaxID=252970 RepID=UPI0009E288EE
MPRGRKAQPLRERFERKFIVTPGCWLWTAGRSGGAGGYGKFTVNGKQVGAHCVSYELYVGPIPPGKLLRHTCDVPGCVNPDHLIPGTHKENSDDKFSRGRQGCTRVRRKLTDDEIRAVRAATGPQRAIAERFGVAQATVHRIKSGESWWDV